MREFQLADGARPGMPLKARLTACLLVLLYALGMLGLLRALAQEPAPAPARMHSVAAVPADLQSLITQQFGPCFQLATERTGTTVKYLHPEAGPPWVPFLVADLDGDGIEDAVIVARCKSPLAEAGGYGYKVIDPYFDHYGYGNPNVTSQFSAADPDRQNLILVIHGAGKEGWRADTPKSKFVVLNAPFASLNLTRVAKKKNVVVPALSLVEAEGLTSNLFWDGKKWKWQEGSTGQ
jgi:hypothetical protein